MTIYSATLPVPGGCHQILKLDCEAGSGYELRQDSFLLPLSGLYSAMLDQDVLTNFRTSRLITLFLQSILYGIYIITSGSCARALTRVNGRWRSRRELQWPFLLAGAFLLVNTTYNVCIRLYNFLIIFVYRGSDRLSIPNTFSRWSLVVEVRYTATIFQVHTKNISCKPTQLLSQSTVGDFVLIYRTFIVYRRNWKVIAPSVILWLAAIACAGRALQLEATGATPNRFGPWFTAFWALSVSHNIITTRK